MATSPAVLNAYLQFNGALSHGTLPPRVREQLALAIGQANECDYCLSAHTVLGKMAGLTPDQVRDSRHGTASDPKTDALLKFARTIVEKRGLVSDDDLRQVREAGYTDGAIAEVVAHVALNVFTNYFNTVAGTDIDFPPAGPLT
jgi:AhpD family alkylhydroperoxidase